MGAEVRHHKAFMMKTSSGTRVCLQQTHLQDCKMYYTGKNFVFHSGEEHRNVKRTQLGLKFQSLYPQKAELQEIIHIIFGFQIVQSTESSEI